jgi:alpha-glucosidase
MTDEWWRGAVIYQIYPRSFADSDGDGVGDLPGIIDRLPHVADLGVDGIWLSPFFTSPMADFGYDVSDYCGVDPLFGTMADAERLIERAHELGLKVIIDQVYSHTSDRHDWFQKSRRKEGGKADWYIWAEAKEDGSPPNNWLSVFGGPAWSWDTGRGLYYMHNFLREQPDLNFHEPAVQDAILDVAKFWLEKGVDGFRLDVANYYRHDAGLRDNPPGGPAKKTRPYHYQAHLHNRSRPDNLDFIERYRALLDRYPAKMAVAEIFSDQPVLRSVEYTEGARRLHTAYSFGFLHADELSAELIRSQVEAWSEKDAWPSWSFSNHDVARVLSRWGGEDAPAAMAVMLNQLLLSLRGTAFLYQGEELGLPQAEVPYERLRDPEAIRFYPDNLGRDGCRTPMPWSADGTHAGFSTTEPWLPIDPRHAALAADQQGEGSVLQITKAFLAWRKDQPALRGGTIEFLDTEEPILAFRRGGDLLCAFNFSGEERSFSLPSPAGEVTGVSQGAETKTDGTLTLAPYGTCFSVTA